MAKAKTQQNKKTKSNFSIADTVVFVIAVFALSRFFGAAKYFETGNTDVQGFLAMVFSAAIFIFCLSFLAYSIYIEEKSNNNLRTSFFFFDWLETKMQIWKESIDRRKKNVR